MQGDGQYAVAFVPLRPGLYSLTLRLYYTLCWGYQVGVGPPVRRLSQDAVALGPYSGSCCCVPACTAAGAAWPKQP